MLVPSVLCKKQFFTCSIILLISLITYIYNTFIIFLHTVVPKSLRTAYIGYDWKVEMGPILFMSENVSLQSTHFIVVKPFSELDLTA